MCLNQNGEVTLSADVNSSTMSGNTSSMSPWGACVQEKFNTNIIWNMKWIDQLHSPVWTFESSLKIWYYISSNKTRFNMVCGGIYTQNTTLKTPILARQHHPSADRIGIFRPQCPDVPRFHVRACAHVSWKRGTWQIQYTAPVCGTHRRLPYSAGRWSLSS